MAPEHPFNPNQASRQVLGSSDSIQDQHDKPVNATDKNRNSPDNLPPSTDKGLSMTDNPPRKPDKAFQISDKLMLILSGLVILLLTVADWIHIYPVMLRSVGYDFTTFREALYDKPDILMVMLAVHSALLLFSLRGNTSAVVTLSLILLAFNLQYWWLDLGPAPGKHWTNAQWIKAAWPGLLMTSLHIFLLGFFSNVFLQYRQDDEQKRKLYLERSHLYKQIKALEQEKKALSKQVLATPSTAPPPFKNSEQAQFFPLWVKMEVKRRKYDQIKASSHERQIYRLKEQIAKGDLGADEKEGKLLEIFLREWVMG